MADELGRLEAYLLSSKITYSAQIEKSAARAAEITSELLAWAHSAKADESVLVAGKMFDAIISKRDNKRTITNMPGLFTTLGRKTFLENCSITLTALDRLLTRDSQLPFVTEDRCGHRSVTTAQRAK